MISERYGRKIGFARLLVCYFLDSLGFYRTYRRVRWHEVRRFVFVCNGNICRSPYAQARARQLGLTAVSAGLRADDRGPADSYAIRLAAERSLDLASHRTTNVAELLLENGDLVLCMEPAQAIAMREFANARTVQVTLLGLWAAEPRPYLQDPYGLSDGYWHTCFSLIDSAVEHLAQCVKIEHANVGYRASNADV